MNHTSFQRTIDISHYAPPVSRESVHIQEVYRIENEDLQVLWDSLIEVFNNEFLDYMGQYGIQQWERIFDVIPFETDSEQDRRERIKALIAGDRPYTLERFQMMLDGMFGEQKVKATLNADKYEIWFDVTKDLVPLIPKIKAYAESIVPKNLLLLASTTKEARQPAYIGGLVTTVALHHIAANQAISEGYSKYGGYIAGYVKTYLEIRIV